jgi:hypothetical protein
LSRCPDCSSAAAAFGARIAPLFAAGGRPAESPWLLALVTVMPFAEGLSDRQAAEAVRARIDWKYALVLDLVDPSFDFSVLSEFRARLIRGLCLQTRMRSSAPNVGRPTTQHPAARRIWSQRRSSRLSTRTST